MSDKKCGFNSELIIGCTLIILIAICVATFLSWSWYEATNEPVCVETIEVYNLNGGVWWGYIEGIPHEQVIDYLCTSNVEVDNLDCENCSFWMQVASGENGRCAVKREVCN